MEALIAGGKWLLPCDESEPESDWNEATTDETKTARPLEAGPLLG